LRSCSAWLADVPEPAEGVELAEDGEPAAAVDPVGAVAPEPAPASEEKIRPSVCWRSIPEEPLEPEPVAGGEEPPPPG
jgi:hypothetical protein